jgi:hypothetical protein
VVSTLYPREKAIKSAPLASPILFKVRTSLITKAKLGVRLVEKGIMQCKKKRTKFPFTLPKNNKKNYTYHIHALREKCVPTFMSSMM